MRKWRQWVQREMRRNGRLDPGSLVFYKTEKTSVNSKARGGKANLERQKIQDVEIAQNYPVPCLLPRVRG